MMQGGSPKIAFTPSDKSSPPRPLCTACPLRSLPFRKLRTQQKRYEVASSRGSRACVEDCRVEALDMSLCRRATIVVPAGLRILNIPIVARRFFFPEVARRLVQSLRPVFLSVILSFTLSKTLSEALSGSLSFALSFALRPSPLASPLTQLFMGARDSRCVRRNILARGTCVTRRLCGCRALC